MPLHLPQLPAMALALDPNCASNSTACNAGHFLHWLYAAAAVLAVILLLVIALAIHLWRKNKDGDFER